MAAYRADIEIGVRGAQQLQALTKQITTLSTGVDAVNKRLAGAAQSLNAYDANLAKAASTLNKVNAGTIAERNAVQQYVVALGQANAARDRQNQLIQQQIVLQRKAVATANAGFGVQGPALPSSASSRSRSSGSGRAGNAISSAIIGGGFPLLFGQGPAAAAGGALGGVAGGLLGGGFGFALSIAGTAIGDFIAQADKLDVTLAGLNAAISSTGSASITTANDVSQLAKNLQITKDEAIELVSAFSQFNEGNIRESLARGFGAVGGAQTFEAIAKAGLGEKEALDAIFSLRKQIGNEAAEQLALQLRSVGATETQAALLKIVSERNIDILVAQSKTVQFTDRLLSTFEGIVAALASAVSLAVRFIAKMQEGSLIKLPFLDRIQQVLGRIVGRTPEQIAGERGAKLEQQLRKELDDLRKALRQETRAQGVQASIADTLKPDRGGKSAAEREAERLAQQRQKQLEAAARMAVLTEGELQKAIATTEVEKLNTDYAQQRMERMIKYETLYKEALSSAEIEYLLMAQSNEILTENFKYQEKVLEIEKQQTEELYKQLSAAGILNEQVQKRLKRGAMPEGGADKRIGIMGYTSGLNLDPNDKAAQKYEEMKQRLKELSDPINMAEQGALAIGDAFSTAFQGIISGTQTTQEALSNFFKGVGDAFISMATEIIAQMVVMFAFKQLLGLFGGGGGGGGMFSGQGPVTMPAAGVGGGASMFMPGIPSVFAEGGFVTGPTNALIGEGGEPEYVIPASKMRGAMSRYSAGARGSSVIPGSGETATADNGAMTTAPIDVRYTVERINNVDYVTSDQFQRGMEQATRQGAALGKQQVYSELTNKRSLRSRLAV